MACAPLNAIGGVAAFARYVVVPGLTAMAPPERRWTGWVGFGDAAWMDIPGLQLMALSAIAALVLLGGGGLVAVGLWTRWGRQRRTLLPAALVCGCATAAGLVAVELFLSYRPIAPGGLPAPIRIGGQTSMLVANAFLVVAVCNVIALGPARRVAASIACSASERARNRARTAGWFGVVSASGTLVLSGTAMVGATLYEGGRAAWEGSLHLPFGDNIEVPFVLALALALLGPVGAFASGTLVVHRSTRDPARVVGALTLLAATAVLSAVTALGIGFVLQEGVVTHSSIWTGPIGGTFFGITALLALRGWLGDSAVLREEPAREP